MRDDASPFREMLPPDVRKRIEEREAAGVSMEEQGRDRSIEPRPIAPQIATDEVEGLFGVTEDPQSGTVHYLKRPEERE